MKETVLDVLMYLFESFIDSEDEPEPNRNELKEELERAGFGQREVERFSIVKIRLCRVIDKLCESVPWRISKSPIGVNSLVSDLEPHYTSPRWAGTKYKF